MNPSDPDPAAVSRRAQIWLSSRLIALALYGIMGVEVGTAIILGGAPATVEDQFGPWIRLALGAPCFVGGLLTLLASIFGDRSRRGWWVALAGTCLLALWGAGMATTYGVAAIDAGVEILRPDEVATLGVSRLYVPFLYQSLFLLIAMHVVTILRLGRPRR